MTETRLSGILIRTGSIPTSALGGGVVSSSAQIITALPAGTVSSSAQVISGGSADRVALFSGDTTLTSNSGLTYASSILSVTGEVRATNEITAFFSDERLKITSSRIENALDKVMSIGGYYYTENELAKSFGFNSGKQHVGVLAQQVQKVLPEVIRTAPFATSDGTDVPYLTVQYEKLVPLLIEAIKELKTELDELKKNTTSYYR